MPRQITPKERIFWAPSLETARNIDNADAVLAIEAARHRFTTSLRDLEAPFDAKASELRGAYRAEVQAHVGDGDE